jgi:uncharacterized UPF0160 family protein
LSLAPRIPRWRLCGSSCIRYAHLFNFSLVFLCQHALALHQEFVEAIDAIDNGIGQYGKDATPLYRSRTDLSSRVGHLNPAWNEVSNDNVLDVSSMSLYWKCRALHKWDPQSQFAKASKLAGDEFMGRLDYYGKAWLPARDLVSQALAARFNADESGKIILFESFLPWKVRLI